MSGEQFSAKMERRKGEGWDADIISRFGGYTICYYGHTHTHTHTITQHREIIFIILTQTNNHKHTYTHTHRHTKMTDRHSRSL